jgi:signal transduction histidine kinase
MMRSQRHLLGLINEVLDFARIESGEMYVDSEDFQIADVMRAAEESVLPLAKQKSLRYCCIGDVGVSVRGDRTRARQVVVNLLANAVKFTEPGGTLEVNCACGDGIVCIKVRDTGMGIPADRLDSIFEPFVQVDARFSRAHGGVGLGLAISRRFALAMGGDLAVESVLGEGSTFTLTLPAAQPPLLTIVQ